MVTVLPFFAKGRPNGGSKGNAIFRVVIEDNARELPDVVQVEDIDDAFTQEGMFGHHSAQQHASSYADDSPGLNFMIQ